MEFLDEEGRLIESFTAAEHERIYYNDLHRRVRFRGKADLSSLAVRTVRLRFTMRNCQLYAFHFLQAEK